MAALSPDQVQDGSLDEVESPSDFGPRPEDTVAYWLAQDKIAEKLEQKWARQARKIVKRYRDERARTDDDTHRFNVLWSNIQVIKPAVYAQTPKPDIERRFHDQDDTGRLASILLERCVSISLGQCDFDSQMLSVVEDVLLPGRGTLRAMYIPHYGDELPNADEGGLEESGATADVGNVGDEDPAKTTALREVVWEEARIQYLFWEDYREGPARKWQEVPWVRYRCYMTRAELVDRFGPKGKQINLDSTAANSRDNSRDDLKDPIASLLKKAEIWEIWDKTEKRALWIAPGSPECGLLDSADDPLKLPGFFPNPEPLLATTTNDTRIPVPDFIEYMDQATELDLLTARVDVLLKALKVAGVYPGSAKSELAQLLEGGVENKLIAVPDWVQFSDKGGLQNMIQYLPIKEIAETVIQLYGARDRTKQTLYEVMGLSDIMRGATNANETLGAQNLKVQFGTLRMSDRQRAVARMARDAIRLCAGIIGTHFSPKTIAAMTGYPQLLPMPQPPQAPPQQAMLQPPQGNVVPMPGQPPVNPAMQQFAMAMQQYQQAAQAVQAKNAQLTQQFAQACQMIQSDIVHGFRIDIEADSTIVADEQQTQQATTQFLEALLPMLQQIIPAAQGNPAFAGFGKELVLYAVRQFRAGRALEESIEKLFNTLQSGPPAQPQGQGGQQGAAGNAAAAQASVAGAKMQADAKTQAAQLQASVEQQANDQKFQLGQAANQERAAYHAGQLALQQNKLDTMTQIQNARLLNQQAKGAAGLV